MHELSIIESILRITTEQAKKNKAKKILSINIKVGVISGFLPELIQEYFTIASKGTIAEGAVLNIENIQIRIKCLNCSFENIIDAFKIRCPSCESTKVKIIAGREFYIDSMEVE